jgi:hypothetical protein
MNVLVIDIGGTHVKVLAAGKTVHRAFDFRARLDTEADDYGGEETGRGLEV